MLDWVPDPAALAPTTQSLLQQGHTLSDAQEARLREAFLLFDKDGDGALDAEEVVDVLRAVDVAMPEATSSQIMSSVRASFEEDGEGGGERALRSLSSRLGRRWSGSGTKTDGRKQVPAAAPEAAAPSSPRASFTEGGLGSPRGGFVGEGGGSPNRTARLEEVMTLIRSIDTDHDGRVSYDEIKQAVLTHAFYRCTHS